MATVPVARTNNRIIDNLRLSAAEGTNWARIASGASLLASGLLLLTGKRKAGLLSAVAGTALAILDQQATVKSFWHSMPGYIDRAQHLLGQVEETVSEVAAQRERLHRILTR
jgi:hypothetical protein